MLSMASQDEGARTDGNRFFFRFYPKPTGDPGHDRHVRTLQFACLLLAMLVGMIVGLDVIEWDVSAVPTLGMALAGLIAALVMNRSGAWKSAGWTAFLSILLTAILLVGQARDGFRSLAMLLFPGLLLISVMLLSRIFYIATAGGVLITVAVLGIAEMHGLTRAIPGVRSPTNYESIFYVDLILLVFAIIGSHFMANARTNIFDLRSLISRLSSTNVDLTESTRALRASEAALRESERHLKNAERIAHVGHWQWDLKSDRISASEEMYRIFGKPLDYVFTYNGFLNDLAPPDRERMQEVIKDSRASKARCAAEYQIVNGIGDWRTISSVWEFLTDDDGAPVRLFGTSQDITESRRLQHELFSRQKLETVGTLASGIAHDFNNLLGAVVSQAELALEELVTGSRPQEELNAIREVAIRGSEIVRQLMIYAGKDHEAHELVDVAQIVKEMLGLLKISATKHVQLETDFGEDLPAVWANAAEIRQIVMNLVTNAAEAIGERHGVIRVTTRCVKVDPGSPAAISDQLVDGDYVELEVSDTGSGMSDETQARVFDPFFTTKFAGHGLGLAVVSGIVRSLGGAIRLKSEPSTGTMFQILLPSAKTMTGRSNDSTQGSELLPGPEHVAVLVVEDEDALRKAVAKLLRKAGFQVFEAADGSSAIEVLRTESNKLHLVLLDMTIPGASAQEVVAEVAKTHPETKVVLTSAYSREMIAHTVDRPQVISFIRKPFRIDDLVETIRDATSAAVKG